MDDAIRSLLSQEVVEAFHTNLRTKRSMDLEDIPNQLPTVSTVLRKYFGPSADTIEKTIVQRLYSRYGLEFRKNDDYELNEYINNARNELGFAAPTVEPVDVNLPLTGEFDQLLVESVREAIEDSIGKDQAKLAFRILERDVTFEKLPRHLPTFYLSLKRNFGKNSEIIELAIARKLYMKLSLEFIETPHTELSNYVQLAFIKLNQREQLGFTDLTGKLNGHSSTT